MNEVLLSLLIGLGIGAFSVAFVWIYTKKKPIDTNNITVRAKENSLVFTFDLEGKQADLAYGRVKRGKSKSTELFQFTEAKDALILEKSTEMTFGEVSKAFRDFFKGD